MRRPRLLIVDDEPALANFLASAAKECGFDALITTRGHDFQKEYVASPPAMVALDLGMPGTDGVEHLRFLAMNQFTGPVLIVSGFDSRVLEAAFRLGETMGLNMAGTLEKPVRLDDLEKLLERVRAKLAA